MRQQALLVQRLQEAFCNATVHPFQQRIAVETRGKGMMGITKEALAEAHQADLDIQDDEGVNFKHAWADPKTGKVFCLSEAPNAEAVKRIHQRSGHPTDQVFEVPVQA